MKPFYENKTRYRVAITRQGFTEAASGNIQFFLCFDVIAKVVHPAEVEVAQQSRIYFKAITDKTIEYLAEDLKTLGYTGETLSDLDPEAGNHISFVGCEVFMYCQYEADPKTGEDREKWSVARAGGGTFEAKPVNRAKLAELDKRFGALTKQGSKPIQKPDGPPPLDFTGTGVTEDDVPF
jgi:hypothetical protein